VECGKVSDGCGGSIDCDKVDGFGCTEDATCKKNKCTQKAPPVKKSDQASPDDPDVQAKTKGEPGDVGGDGDKSDTPLHAPAKKAAASGGCSAAPSSGGTSSSGLLLALAVATCFVRRRRSR
jgi:MYXO-CTERM domain-containing protein